jgi:hypothetical protein
MTRMKYMSKRVDHEDEFTCPKGVEHEDEFTCPKRVRG